MQVPVLLGDLDPVARLKNLASSAGESAPYAAQRPVTASKSSNASLQLSGSFDLAAIVVQRPKTALSQNEDECAGKIKEAVCVPTRAKGSLCSTQLSQSVVNVGWIPSAASISAAIADLAKKLAEDNIEDMDNDFACEGSNAESCRLLSQMESPCWGTLPSYFQPESPMKAHLPDTPEHPNGLCPAQTPMQLSVEDSASANTTTSGIIHDACANFMQGRKETYGALQCPQECTGLDSTLATAAEEKGQVEVPKIYSTIASPAEVNDRHRASEPKIYGDIMTASNDIDTRNIYSSTATATVLPLHPVTTDSSETLPLALPPVVTSIKTFSPSFTPETPSDLSCKLNQFSAELDIAEAVSPTHTGLDSFLSMGTVSGDDAEIEVAPVEVACQDGSADVENLKRETEDATPNEYPLCSWSSAVNYMQITVKPAAVTVVQRIHTKTVLMCGGALPASKVMPPANVV